MPVVVDVVIPAHNEAESIGRVIREFATAMDRLPGARVRFIVCEDGSSDGTADVVRELARELPIELISSSERKGYSRAVVDGLRAASARLVGFVDSDGQCDPSDFPKFLKAIGDADMVVGFRCPRRDPWYRLAMSRAFGVVYHRLFAVVLRDPSCPYLLVRKEALDRVLHGQLGVLSQGFWWEFQARASAVQIRVAEVPCQHRSRLAGQTQVYRPRSIPGIAGRHLVALFRLRRELRQHKNARLT